MRVRYVHELAIGAKVVAVEHPYFSFSPLAERRSG